MLEPLQVNREKLFWGRRTGKVRLLMVWMLMFDVRVLEAVHS